MSMTPARKDELARREICLDVAEQLERYAQSIRESGSVRGMAVSFRPSLLKHGSVGYERLGGGDREIEIDCDIGWIKIEARETR